MTHHQVPWSCTLHSTIFTNIEEGYLLCLSSTCQVAVPFFFALAWVTQNIMLTETHLRVRSGL